MSRAAINLVKKEGVTETNLDLIFTPALQDYDFTLEVKANNITASSGVLPPNTFKNLIQPLTSFPDDITTRYDLIQGYVDELNRKFGNAIIFSSKKFTGLCKDNKNVVGGIFVPANLAKKNLESIWASMLSHLMKMMKWLSIRTLFMTKFNF